MNPHQTLIETFYRAFTARDAEGMIACYHPRVRFTDEVLDLEGARSQKDIRASLERCSPFVRSRS